MNTYREELFEYPNTRIGGHGVSPSLGDRVFYEDKESFAVYRVVKLNPVKPVVALVKEPIKDQCFKADADTVMLKFGVLDWYWIDELKYLESTEDHPTFMPVEYIKEYSGKIK